MRRILLPITALALVVTACNKDGISSDYTAEEEALAARYDAAADLYSSLAGQSVTPEDIVDLNGRTWEPVYGDVLEENDPYRRSVLVRDADQAETFFLLLCGSTDEVVRRTEEGYAIDFSDLGLGTLKFHGVPDGPNVGYVEVKIPAFPHLQRIDYLTEEQMGINAAGKYVSPAEPGDVFLKDGRYYICTRAATGWTDETCGLLVCIEAGKGTMWENYLDKEKWGCWRPLTRWTDARYIVHFLNLCADHGFTPVKKAIVETYPGKVFPKVQHWGWNKSRKYYQDDEGDLTWGFGALVGGYSHVTRYYSNLDDEPSHSDKERKKWKNRKVVIARDATEGDYKWKKAKWERRFHYYEIPYVCRWDKGIERGTKKYTGQGGWEDFFEDNTLIVYTLNPVKFYETLDASFVMQTLHLSNDDDDEDDD